jgi:hypothetical protein
MNIVHDRHALLSDGITRWTGEDGDAGGLGALASQD